jgi:hypothetical protein
MLLTIALIVVLLLTGIGVVLAAGASYAFGYRTIPNVRGLRTYVWTGIRPDNQVWTASPLGVCQNFGCAGKLVETGWVDGTSCWPDIGCIGDVLQQYVTYIDVNNTPRMVLHQGNLADNTWYQLKVLYSTSAGRWEAWRGSDVVWFIYNLGWVSGNGTAYGSEAANANNWMDVYGYWPEYKAGNDPWVQFVHEGPPGGINLGGGGCLVYAYREQGVWRGYRGYGPAQTCNPNP